MVVFFSDKAGENFNLAKIFFKVRAPDFNSHDKLINLLIMIIK